MRGDCCNEVLQVLTDYDVDVNTNALFGLTALFFASAMGNVNSINVLLRAEADHNIANALGETPVHYAIMGRCMKESLQALVNCDADVNTTNKQNQTV